MIGKYLVTITRVDDDACEEPNFRNVRNKTVLASLIQTRYSTIKRRIKMNKAYRKLPICSKEEFFEWAIKSPELVELFEAWTKAGHPHRLIPSIDRIEPKKGYVISNLRWIALHENSGRARKL
jgi:hypothetical protein